MKENQLTAICERLRGNDPHVVLEALIELSRSIPELGGEDRRKLASTVSNLFCIDTVSLPEFTSVVDMAVRVVTAMGPALIPHHLEEMRGTDFKGLFCFARVLAALGTESVKPILEACDGADDDHLLVGALYALTKIRDESVMKGFPLIVDLCNSPKSEVRDAAVGTLGELVEHLPSLCFSQKQRKRAFEALLAATRGPTPGTRAKGVRGLGKMADKGLLSAQARQRTLNRIRQVLGRHKGYTWDTAYIVRKEAEEAMGHLTG